DRERLRVSLRPGCIALVDEVRHEREQEGARERGRRHRVGHDDTDLARLYPPEGLDEADHVELVGETLSVRLEEDGKVGVAGCHGEQVRCALSLHPERGAPPRTPPWQEQSPGCG